MNSLPLQSDMFAGLPVKGATTAWSFGALAIVAIASAAVAGLAGGVAHARGGAAL